MTVSLKQKLEKLRIKYISSLPARMKKISLLAHQLNTKKWTHNKRNLFINLIHRMVGSGKTFGVNDLSEIAAELEKFCREKLMIDTPVSPQIKTNIELFIKELNTIAFKAGNNEGKEIPEHTPVKKTASLE